MANEFKIKNGAIVQKIKPFADSTTALQINNTGDTATIFNLDSINKRIGLNNLAPTTTLDISGDFKVTGSTAGTTVLSINGTSGNLFSITDIQTGTLFQVSDISGIPLLQVDSTGYIYQNSGQILGMTAATTLYQILKINGTAAFVDYRVSNAATGAYRAGTMSIVWDGTNVEYHEIRTPDLVASTAGIVLSSVISGNYLNINAVISTGTWNVKLGVRLI